MTAEESAVPVGEPSFSDWYGEAYQSVVRTIVILTKDPSKAAEAADEAFLRAYERWDKVREMESPKAWVVRVAINHGRRLWRRQRVEQSVLAGAALTVADLTHRDLVLWDAVTKLPPRQREAIALKYVADLTEREVALSLGVSTGGASSLLAKARESLRLALEHTYER